MPHFTILYWSSSLESGSPDITIW